MGKIADLDPALSFKQQADQADNWYFTDYSADKILAIRRQLMEAGPQDLLGLAGILDQAVGESAVCVIGSPEAIDRFPSASLIDIS
jgi:hypothetical protein